MFDPTNDKQLLRCVKGQDRIRTLSTRGRCRHRRSTAPVESIAISVEPLHPTLERADLVPPENPTIGAIGNERRVRAKLQRACTKDRTVAFPTERAIGKDLPRLEALSARKGRVGHHRYDYFTKRPTLLDVRRGSRN